LWVDRLDAFAAICPAIDQRLAVQGADGVEVRRWEANFPQLAPGDLVIEAFACRLPDAFVAAMAARDLPPVWISLDYLSAEDWVAGCHALPSPHQSQPLIKYFFFPGFAETTGGLLRERDLERRRQAYLASPTQQKDFWRPLGGPPPADALLVSLFAYANAALASLLELWAQGSASICCLAPLTRTLPGIEAFCGQALQAGDVVRRGQLEIRVLPFLAQPDYDKLLWSCNLNFVRGEDSFVRAQWAAKPMVWHIYPQDEDAHLPKLNAFLDLYCRGLGESLPEATAAPLRRLFMAWNKEEDSRQISAALWAEFVVALPDLRRHAMHWRNNLSKQQDLCSKLVCFCRSKL
jgi:uncharacterized repeat protein (TIGR03837 family)